MGGQLGWNNGYRCPHRQPPDSSPPAAPTSCNGIEDEAAWQKTTEVHSNLLCLLAVPWHRRELLDASFGIATTLSAPRCDPLPVPWRGISANEGVGFSRCVRPTPLLRSFSYILQVGVLKK